MTLITAPRTLAVLALLAAILMLNACGSDSPDEVADTASVPTTVADQPSPEGDDAVSTPEPEESEPAGDEPADPGPVTDEPEPEITECSAADLPGSGRYVVSGIPASDPDGGLVAHVGPGASTASTGVFPEGSAVIVSQEAAACARTGDGGTWWAITTGDGGEGWVNARYVARVSDVEEASNVAEICDLYSQVVSYEGGDDPVPGRLAESLKVAVDGIPVGVSSALDTLWQTDSETERAGAFTTVRGYLSPVCE